MNENNQVCSILRYRVKNGDPDILRLAYPGYEACAISSIERRFKVSTSEVPVLTKRAENRYILDTGVTESIIIVVTRCEPASTYDEGTDQTRWSNAKWMREVHEFFDGWQNLNYNSEGLLAGGFTLVWLPADYESTSVIVEGIIDGDCAYPYGHYSESDNVAYFEGYLDPSADMFPPIFTNVFISNNLEYSYGYYTKLTLMFTVGTLKPSIEHDIGKIVDFQYGESSND